jgi:hypothetical protein
MYRISVWMALRSSSIPLIGSRSSYPRITCLKKKMIGANEQHYNVVIKKNSKKKLNGIEEQQHQDRRTPGLLACCQIVVILFNFFTFSTLPLWDAGRHTPGFLPVVVYFFLTYCFLFITPFFFKKKSTCLLPRRACHSFFQISNDVSERICLKNVFVSMPAWNFFSEKSVR